MGRTSNKTEVKFNDDIALAIAPLSDVDITIKTDLRDSDEVDSAAYCIQWIDGEEVWLSEANYSILLKQMNNLKKYRKLFETDE